MQPHAAIAALAPLLATEKSKTPFYIAGGVLVAWALLVSLGLGMRRNDFPHTLGLQRLVMAVSAVLVAVAVASAVATSGGSRAKASGAVATPGAEGSATTAQGPATPTTEGSATPTARGPATPSAGGQAASGGAATRLAESADPSGQLRFTSAQLRAKAGSVSIDFANSSPLAHNFTLARASSVLGATPTFQGGSKTLTVRLAAGVYKFFCTVPGHREAGMEGTLTVS